MLHQFLYDAMIQEALIRCGRCDISATRRFVTIWTRVAELRGWDVRVNTFAHELVTNEA